MASREADPVERRHDRRVGRWTCELRLDVANREVSPTPNRVHHGPFERTEGYPQGVLGPTQPAAAKAFDHADEKYGISTRRGAIPARRYAADCQIARPTKNGPRRSR